MELVGRDKEIQILEQLFNSFELEFLALISANVIHNNYYAENLFTGFATLDDLFKLYSNYTKTF